MRQYLKKNILVLFFFILQFITKIYIYFPLLGVATNGANSIPETEKNSSFGSETISDLLTICCAHVTASIIRTFPPCFTDQMPFLLLCLQPIYRICSFTFSSFFVHPVPLISQYFLSFFFNLPLQYLSVIYLFRFMCFNHSHTREGHSNFKPSLFSLFHFTFLLFRLCFFF